MIKIKCVFPKNYYFLRKVNVKINNNIIAQVGHKEIIELDEIFDKLLIFKLDYHKTEIKIPKSKKNIFLILYFDFRNYFPFYITDIMFRNSLRTKFVEEAVFENFNESFYEVSSKEKINFTSFNMSEMVLGILISCGITISSLVKYDNTNDINNLSFFVGIINIIGFLLIYLNRKDITEKVFSIRLLAFGISSILILSYVDTNILFKTFSIIISSIITLISIMKIKKAPNNT
jgi:hypothetical protein